MIEVEEMTLRFKCEKFPVLKDHKIIAAGDKVMLEITKEFNSKLDNMKFN